MFVLNELNDDNFEWFALRHYHNPRGSEIEDFYEDLKRIKYIKRLVNRYLEKNKLQTRLLLNHIIIFFNAFTIPAALRILEFKLDEKSWVVIKPFLLHLNYIRETDYTSIPSDLHAFVELRKI